METLRRCSVINSNTYELYNKHVSRVNITNLGERLLTFLRERLGLKTKDIYEVQF